MSGKSQSSQTSNSQQVSAPWAPAQGTLTGILDQLGPLAKNAGLTGAQDTALAQLEQNAQGGNPYAGQIGAFTNNLLGGGGANAQAGNFQGALNQYQERLSPFANGKMVGNNTDLKAYLDTIRSDVGNDINSQFAAAGRDFSGANQQAYGRGVTQALAPIMANQYNQDVQNQIGAAGALYGAGNTTGGLLTGLNQQGLGNQQQGMGNANEAIAAQNYTPAQMLQLEQLKKSLPAESLGLLAQIGIPIGALGGQVNTTGSQTGTNQMSGAQQFATIAGGFGSLFGGKR